MARRLVSVCALSGALCCAPLASAQTVIPWPAAGAPLCTAPGDQFSLSSWLLGFASWFSHSGAADSLYFGGAGDEPPTGECGSGTAVTAGVVPGSVKASQFETNVCLGCPGCGCAVDLAHTWVSRDATGDQVVLRVRRSGLVDWPDADIVVRTAGSGQITLASFAASGPNLPDSSAVVVWAEGTGPASQVRAQRVRPQEAQGWNAPDGIVLSTAGTAPSVLSMGSQSVLVVWEDHRGASSDILALRLQLDGTPAPGWPAGGLPLEGRSEAGTKPHLVAAGNDFLVVWEESGARFGGGKSIVARKLLASGLPDPAWPDSGIVVTSSPTVDHLEDVSTFGSYIVWSDVRNAGPGNPNDLFAQSLNYDGTRAAGWPADGVALSTAAGSQDHARTVYGGLYAWEDTRSGEAKVYVTRLDLSGNRPCCWLPDGNPAAIAAGVQQRPVIEGQFVYWEDGRDLATNGLDIYAQAFLADGMTATVVGVDDGRVSPRVALREPFPNPARTTTHLHLDLSRSAHVRVSVHDLLGRSVRTLNDGALEAGFHDWDWGGTDDAGSRVPAGLYHVRALVDGVASTRSLVWIR